MRCQNLESRFGVPLTLLVFAVAAAGCAVETGNSSGAGPGAPAPESLPVVKNAPDTSVLDEVVTDISNLTDQQVADIANTTISSWLDEGYDEPSITKPEYHAAAIAELQVLGFKTDPDPLIYDPKQRAAVLNGARYYYWTKDAKVPYVEDTDARSRLGVPADDGLTEGDVHSVSCLAGLIRTGPGDWAGFNDDKVGDPFTGKVISVRRIGVDPVTGTLSECKPAT